MNEEMAGTNVSHHGNTSYINLELNEKLVLDYLVVTLVIVICLAFGVIGNLLVIKVYYCNIRVDPLSGRAFIPALAVMDLLACVAGSAIYLVQNLQPASFSGDGFCKSLYILAYSCSMGASLMLVIISVHRHRKVCMPFRRQFPVLLVKFSPFLAGGLGLILAFPMIRVVGEYKYVHSYYNMYGKKCTVLYHTHMKVYFWIYFTVIASVFFGTCVVISALSFKIHRIIQKQIMFRKSSTVSSDKSLSLTPSPHEKEESESELNSSTRGSSSTRGNSGRRLFSTILTNGTGSSRQARPKPKREKREYATMFLLISIIYVITWFPTLVVNGVKVIWLGIEEWSTPPAYVTLRLLNSLFTLNNIANPLIYFKFDREFRKHLLSFRCRK